MSTWSTGHGPPFCTGIRASFSSSTLVTLLFIGKPSISYPQGIFPSKQSGAAKAHVLQWGWAWIYAGSLCPIKVAMVTPGLCYLDFWWAGHSCFPSSKICQESGRDAEKAEMLNKMDPPEFTQTVDRIFHPPIKNQGFFLNPLSCELHQGKYPDW
jgi:hypothetical protein